DAIASVLERTKGNLCLGCVTGEYPYDIEGESTDRDVSRPVVGSESAPADD
ncbi:MAG: amidophosphoribosyltransferase, partial [Haloplanus sp.]